MISFQLKKHHPGFYLDVAMQWQDAIVGIWGPSGSGKSTLLECLAGLQDPDDGEIMLDKRCLFSRSQGIHVPLFKRRIAMVLQHDELFEHLDVRQNVFFGCRKDTPRSLINEVIGSLRLETLMDKRVHTLSGGQRQRVAWGRALLTQPRLLLLDEPVSAMHVSARYEILLMLKRLVGRFGFTVLMVSHLLEELAAVCSIIGVMEEGRLVAQAAPCDISRHPSLFKEWGVSVPWPKNLYEAEAIDCGGMLGLRLEETVLCTAVRCPWPRPSRVCAAVRPVDVVIVKHRPHGISARNVLPVRITGIDRRDDAVLIHTRLGRTHTLRAVITPQSFYEMDLKLDEEVHAVIKAHDIELLYPAVGLME